MMVVAEVEVAVEQVAVEEVAVEEVAVAVEVQVAVVVTPHSTD